MQQPDQLTRFLHQHIPLSAMMQLRAVAWDGECLRLSAPLAPNVNDKGTAFGGSLYTLAVLCGWSLLHLKLEAAGIKKNLVIHEAATRYLLPVTGELHAECRVTAQDSQTFLDTLQQRGRARITLSVAILQQGQTAMEFTGRYVAHG